MSRLQNPAVHEPCLHSERVGNTPQNAVESAPSTYMNLSCRHFLSADSFSEPQLAIHDFPLQGEFIELNILLKLMGLASSGGAAKAMIAEGTVRVDQQVETRTRRKLRVGDVVHVDDTTLRIMKADN